MRSVFDALKVQALSDLMQKTRVHCNLPPKGKRRARGEGSSQPKSITVDTQQSFADRVSHMVKLPFQRFKGSLQRPSGHTGYKVTMRIQNRLAKEHR